MDNHHRYAAQYSCSHLDLFPKAGLIKSQPIIFNGECTMKELEQGFVNLDTLVSLYAKAKTEGRADVSTSLHRAAEAIAMANAEMAYATTLAAFADETTGS